MSTPTEETTQPTPSLEEGLADCEVALQQLASQAEELTGLEQLPDQWYETEAALIDLRLRLAEDESAPTTAIAQYVTLYCEKEALKAKVTGAKPYSYHPAQQTIYELGSPIVGRALAAEPEEGRLHGILLEALQADASSQTIDLTKLLQAFQSGYDKATVTELLTLRGTEYQEALRTQLLRPRSLRWMAVTDLEHNDGDTFEQTTEHTWDWQARAAAALSGLDDKEARKYTFASSRSLDENVGYQVLHAFEQFGTERIQAITTATGIHGLEGYRQEQLERMEAWAQNPKAVAAELKDQDVIVVMTNRLGDHNGVLKDTAPKVESGPRTLFFEITSMSDVYRYMSLLHKAGIRPSTLLLSAHSSAGEFAIRDYTSDTTKHAIASVATNEALALDRQEDPSVQRFSMEGMKGFARLVEQYMQPSRGLDDDERDKGKRKIIFNGCRLGEKAAVRDIDTDGHIAYAAHESVITKLAKELSAQGIQNGVDIYGADDSLQIHRTDNGVRYSGSVNMRYHGGDREPLDAIRIRLASGRVYETRQKEIALRKAA